MDLEGLISTVDSLPPDEFERLFRHMQERRKAQFAWWEIPEENIARLEEVLRPVHEEAAGMTDEEINEVLDEALAEVRRERKAQNRH
jgi:hypothetical protein